MMLELIAWIVQLFHRVRLIATASLFSMLANLQTLVNIRMGVGVFGKAITLAIFGVLE
jgi:hypothetical protein